MKKHIKNKNKAKYQLTLEQDEKGATKNLGTASDRFECGSEEMFVTVLTILAKEQIERLPVKYPIYDFIEDDMRYLSFLMYHTYDFYKVFFDIRESHSGENMELGVYVGNSGDGRYLYELLGEKAKATYEEAVEAERICEEENQKWEQEKIQKKSGNEGNHNQEPDPGYEVDVRKPKTDEEDEGLLYDNVD